MEQPHGRQPPKNAFSRERRARQRKPPFGRLKWFLWRNSLSDFTCGAGLILAKAGIMKTILAIVMALTGLVRADSWADTVKQCNERLSASLDEAGQKYPDLYNGESDFRKEYNRQFQILVDGQSLELQDPRFPILLSAKIAKEFKEKGISFVVSDYREKWDNASADVNAKYPDLSVDDSLFRTVLDARFKKLEDAGSKELDDSRCIVTLADKIAKEFSDKGMPVKTRAVDSPEYAKARLESIKDRIEEKAKDDQECEKLKILMLEHRAVKAEERARIADEKAQQLRQAQQRPQQATPQPARPAVQPAVQQPSLQPPQPARSRAQQDIDEYMRQANAGLAGVPAAYLKLAKSRNPEEAARGQRLVNEQLAQNEVRRQEAAGIISANEAATRKEGIAMQTQQAEMAAQQARILAEQQRLNRQLQQLRMERE